MGLVDDDQISARKSALLDRLRTADLNTFVRAIAPVPCLHHAVRNVAQIFIAELIDQNDAIANESNAGLLAMRLVNQMRRTDRFPGTRRRDQQLCTMACANTGAKPIDALNLVGAQIHYRSEEHTSELQSLMRNSYAV